MWSVDPLMCPLGNRADTLSWPFYQILANVYFWKWKCGEHENREADAETEIDHLHLWKMCPRQCVENSKLQVKKGQCEYIFSLPHSTQCHWSARVLQLRFVSDRFDFSGRATLYSVSGTNTAGFIARKRWNTTSKKTFLMPVCVLDQSPDTFVRHWNYLLFEMLENHCLCWSSLSYIGQHSIPNIGLSCQENTCNATFVQIRYLRVKV